MEGVLELRPPGIMGKWEEKFFRLDNESLKYFSSDGGHFQAEFNLEQIENLHLESPELNFVCQGRKSRLRGKDDSTIREWFSKLQAFMNGEDMSPGMTGSFQNAGMSGMSAMSTMSPQAVQQNPGMSRLDNLYAEHKKKMDKLQAQREVEQQEEKQKLKDGFAKNLSKTSGYRAKANLTQKNVTETAQRLFDEHKSKHERLELKRQEYEAKEQERINDTKRMNLPTRSSSESGLVTAREAGDRLYSDAERRELWRTQARDAQAKDELTMVRIGVKGNSASSMNRCNDLHKEAASRKDKIDKARQKKTKEEQEAMTKDAVPCGNGVRGANLARLDLLYQEHKERTKKFSALHAEAVMREAKEIEQHQVAPKLNKKQVPLARRRPPPWKDPQYPWPPKVAEVVKEPEKGRQTTHADYALLAIQAAIALRSGYNQYNIRPSDYRELSEKLKKVMKEYRRALEQMQQDAGLASLNARSSQRLFQEHLLPEVEGWAHRLEPDPIRQVEDDLETLLNSAARAQETLKEDVAPGVPWPCGSMKSHPTGVPSALWAYDPGVKTQASAETKAMVRFGPGEGAARHRHLTDLSRLLLVFASCDMLQAGLEHIMKRFEVVDVRNHFGRPGRLGLRYVEVLVVVIVRDGREQVPHVCELRLEPLHFNNATKKSAGTMSEFYADLKKVYQPTHMDLAAVEKIARHVLDKAPEGHRLRSFRAHLGRRFGSTVCGWRRAFGGGRLLSFQRFREVCYSLHCGEHVTELWQELDPNRGGCISLWELDPDAVSLLVKLRSRMLSALIHVHHNKGAELGDGEEIEASMIFARLTSFVRPLNAGALEQHEFRMVARPLGLNVQEADRAFACLDHFPGSMHAPPATIDLSDIQWLKRLPQLLDAGAVSCAQDANDVGGLANVTGSPMPDSNSPLSSYMGGTPPSGGIMSAWEKNGSPAAKAAAAKAGGKSPKADGKSDRLSDMGVDVGMSAESSPNKDIGLGEDPGLGDLGIEVEDDDDFDEDDEEEGEDEDDEDEDDEPDQEETW